MYQAARAFPPLAALALLVALAGCLSACGGEPVEGRRRDGLVFVRLVEGSSEVMRVRVADGAERPVTRTPDREEAWPYWSDIARRLVFEASDPGETRTHDLRLWNPETAGETPVVETPSRNEGWAAWSPSEPVLVFSFRVRSGPTGVSLKDVSSGDVALLAHANRGLSFLRPQLAPRGRQVVAQRRGDGGRGSHLWILAPRRKPRALTHDPAWFDLKGWFTRDGSRVVFSRRPSAGGPHEVAVVHTDGSGLHSLTLPGAEQHSARPSPSRDEIAFVAERDGSLDLFVADLDGGSARALTNTPDLSEFAPRWSPDGNRLVVTVSPAGRDRPRLTDRESLEEARIRVLERDGTERLDVPGMMPDWMPAWR